MRGMGCKFLLPAVRVASGIRGITLQVLGGGRRRRGVVRLQDDVRVTSSSELRAEGVGFLSVGSAAGVGQDATDLAEGTTGLRATSHVRHSSDRCGEGEISAGVHHSVH